MNSNLDCSMFNTLYKVKISMYVNILVLVVSTSMNKLTCENTISIFL